LTLAHAIFLFFAAVLGGALNAVAGGGSFITFPTLLFTGVPPIPANATNTVALWTGLTASTGAFRHRLETPKRILIPLLVSTLIGGTLGAFLLLKTSGHTFLRLLPWLMLTATLLFIFAKKLVDRPSSGSPHQLSNQTIAVVTVIELLVGVYGGYFGGGMGIVLLAMLAGAGMTDIHSMNALKTILSSATNGIAVVAFIVARAVFWPQALVMILGAMIGGYFGAHYSLRLPARAVRWFVILVGTGMTIYFFVRAY